MRAHAMCVSELRVGRFQLYQAAYNEIGTTRDKCEKSEDKVSLWSLSSQECIAGLVVRVAGAFFGQWFHTNLRGGYFLVTLILVRLGNENPAKHEITLSC